MYYESLFLQNIVDVADCSCGYKVVVANSAAILRPGGEQTGERGWQAKKKKIILCGQRVSWDTQGS